MQSNMLLEPDDPFMLALDTNQADVLSKQAAKHLTQRERNLHAQKRFHAKQKVDGLTTIPSAQPAHLIQTPNRLVLHLCKKN